MKIPFNVVQKIRRRLSLPLGILLVDCQGAEGEWHVVDLKDEPLPSAAPVVALAYRRGFGAGEVVILNRDLIAGGRWL